MKKTLIFLNFFLIFVSYGSDIKIISDEDSGESGIIGAGKSAENNLKTLPYLVGKIICQIPEMSISRRENDQLFRIKNDLGKISYWTDVVLPNGESNEELEELFEKLRKSKSPNHIYHMLKLPDQNDSLKEPLDFMYDRINTSLLKPESGLNFSHNVFSVSYGVCSVEPAIRILRDVLRDEKYQSVKHFFVNSYVENDQRLTNVAAYLLQSSLKASQDAALYTSESFGKNNNDELFDDQEDLDLLPKNNFDDSKKNQAIDFFMCIDENLPDNDYKKIVKNLNQNGCLFVHIDKKGNIVLLCFDVVSSVKDARTFDACRYLAITNPKTNVTYEISFWEDKIQSSRTYKNFNNDSSSQHFSVSDDIIKYLKHTNLGKIIEDSLFYHLQQSNNTNEFLGKFFKKIEENNQSINVNKGYNTGSDGDKNKKITKDISGTGHKETNVQGKKDKLPLTMRVVGVCCVLGVLGVLSWPFIKNLWNEHKNKINS